MSKREREEILEAPPLLKPTFNSAEFDELCSKIPDWENDLGAMGDEKIIHAALKGLHFDDIRIPGMIRALRAHFAEVPFRSMVFPAFPQGRARGRYYERGPWLRAAASHIKSVLQIGLGAKVPLLGCSGVKGIGKTEFLLQVGNQAIPAIAKEVNKTVERLFISFNGSGTRNTNLFKEFLSNQPHSTDLSVGCARAFAHVLLQACNVDIKRNIELSTAVDYVRRAAELMEQDVLVLFVDEIGALGDVALETMAALMHEADSRCGKLIFMFAHIDQNVLDKGSSGSGRIVEAVALPALSIDSWEAALNESEIKAVLRHPGLHQLVLSLSGHPRSIFDALGAALAADKSLLTSPNATSLTAARETILRHAKFTDSDDDYVGNIVPKWLAGDALEEQQLIRDGLLHQVSALGGANPVKFIFPLRVMEWARKKQSSCAIARHVKLLFDYDGEVGCGSEKSMEGVMYHFEAAKRTALRGRTLPLRDYYGVEAEAMSSKLVRTNVFFEVPGGQNQVIHFESFEEDNMPEVINALKAGYIVVSLKTSEVGVEYFVPFHTVPQPMKLLVACVQCKFVQQEVDWPEIKRKMAKATEYFTEKGIEFFPVVFTTVDQKSVRPSTVDGGVVFVERDLFHFTNRFGILRLHRMKVGNKLAKEYSFLRRDPTLEQ